MTLECLNATLFNASASTSSLSASKKEESRLRERLARFIASNVHETLTITPAMAKIMLERNTGNRTLSMARVYKYAKDMKNGDWQLTGEPIIFSKDGILNDGQTRLNACIQADVTFRSDVRFGIDREAFTVTGTGAKRTLADVFSIRGEKSGIRLAGALNWLNFYLNGSGASKLSHVDGQKMLDDHPDIRKSIDAGRKLHAQTHLIEPSLAVFLHYVFALKDADRADAFFQFLTEGIGASGKYDPRHVIRERLINNKGDKAKLPSEEIAALVIKSWNTFRSGHQLRSLRWTTNPAKGAPEAFPRAM